MKQCSKCKKIKLKNNFYKNKNFKDGLAYECKKCRSETAKIKSRTKKGVVLKIYLSQKKSSKNRKHPVPDYSKKQLIKWVFLQPNFEEFYNNWVKSNYKRDLTPSCDRLDDYKPYTLDNLQLITWEKNRKKYQTDRMNGINNKQNRAVLQFDLQDNFIKEFYSMHQAERETGIHNSGIWSVCNNKRKTAGKFNWKYKKKYAKKNNNI